MENTVPNANADAASAPPASPSELDQLRAERDELKDTLLRRQAEFDNFRKRTERDRQEQIQFASMEAVREMLPVLDDFERAIAVYSGDSEYARGVRMIHQRMQEVLKKIGLEPIDAEGKEFDPNFHQAVERVETADHSEGAVIGEFQKGYNFKGKLIRPSMVRVAVPVPPPAKSE